MTKVVIMPTYGKKDFETLYLSGSWMATFSRMAKGVDPDKMTHLDLQCLQLLVLVCQAEKVDP